MTRGLSRWASKKDGCLLKIHKKALILEKYDIKVCSENAIWLNEGHLVRRFDQLFDDFR